MKKSFIYIFVLSLLTACSGRSFIRENNRDIIGGRFYLFAELDGEKYQANGDLALIPENRFRLRIYDNLLNKHIMSLESLSNGDTTIVFPLDKIAYQYNDPEGAEIFCHYFYYLFFMPDKIKNSETNHIFVENNQIKTIMFSYGKKAFEIGVLRRFDDGSPRRIQLSGEGQSLIIDIVKFQSLDFTLETGGLSVVKADGRKTFLEWIGDVYGRRQVE